MTYWRLHYHLIWGTFERQASISHEREKIIYGVLYRKAEELGLKIHAAGNTTDHLRIVASIPPKLSVADCVKHFKGASAYAINHSVRNNDQFHWQEGYGALTIGEHSLEAVMAYAARQKDHHGENSIIPIYEKTEEGI